MADVPVSVEGCVVDIVEDVSHAAGDRKIAHERREFRSIHVIAVARRLDVGEALPGWGARRAVQPDQFRAGGQVFTDVVTGASRMGAVGEKVIDRHDAVHVARESPERMDERVGDSVLVQIPAFEAHPELERGIALLEEIALVDANFPQHADHARERALADPDDRHRRRFDQHDLDAASALGGIELRIEEGRSQPSGRAAADDRDLRNAPFAHAPESTKKEPCRLGPAGLQGLAYP